MAPQGFNQKINKIFRILFHVNNHQQSTFLCFPGAISWSVLKKILLAVVISFKWSFSQPRHSTKIKMAGPWKLLSCTRWTSQFFSTHERDKEFSQMISSLYLWVAMFLAEHPCVKTGEKILHRCKIGMGTIPIPRIDTCELGVSIDTSTTYQGSQSKTTQTTNYTNLTLILN